MSEERQRPTPHLPPEVCQDLVEEAPVGVFVVQDGRVVYANRWLREFSGYAADDGQPVDALAAVHPDDRRQVARQMQLRLAGDEALPSYPVRLLRRDGSVCEVRLYPKGIRFGGRPAIQGTLVDITEGMAAERSLQESATRLEESNRYRQLFGDILSHDLMNPVWVAENYLRLAVDGGVPDAKRLLYEGMGRSLAKAREILADARTYLRIQDRDAVAGERADAGQAVAAVAEALRPRWEEKGQQVSLAVDPGAATAAGPLFREIVWQLLSNAVKFGPPGSRVVVVVVAGKRLRLEVRDEGPGVAPADRETIFQRFERMEKGAIGGVGLGLAIVRRIVTLHRGRVWVEDNPRGGSVFVVELPAAD